VYGNPDGLDRSAAQLRQRADVVRTSGRHHEQAGQAARWVSTSASAYRTVASRDRARTDAAVDALDAAAQTAGTVLGVAATPTSRQDDGMHVSVFPTSPRGLAPSI